MCEQAPGSVQSEMGITILALVMKEGMKIIIIWM
jgi:hypothetical protein